MLVRIFLNAAFFFAFFGGKNQNSDISNCRSLDHFILMNLKTRAVHKGIYVVFSWNSNSRNIMRASTFSFIFYNINKILRPLGAKVRNSIFLINFSKFLALINFSFVNLAH
jgi:hypothetical protein